MLDMMARFVLKLVTALPIIVPLNSSNWFFVVSDAAVGKCVVFVDVDAVLLSIGVRALFFVAFRWCWCSGCRDENVLIFVGCIE